MPGKGGMRSRSTPRERPASASVRAQTAGASPVFTRSIACAAEGSSCAGSPRVGTPTGPRKLNSPGSSGAFGSSFSTFGEEKCVCGICTCGRHRCPVQAKTSIAYGGESHFGTTHGESFIAHDGHYQPTRASRSQVYVPGGRFDHTTTHQADYPWHERPTSSHRSTMERAMPGGAMSHSPFGHNGGMDLTTSYGAHFVEHSIPTKSAKPAQATYSYGSPRDLMTTKQLDYSGAQPPRCPASVLPTRPGSARSGHVKYNMDLSGTWS